MKTKRHIAILLILAALPAMTVLPAAAEAVACLPGVTGEMTDPAYWIAAMESPDAILATAEDIARINAAALTADAEEPTA